jgi:hypothetical protein
MQSMHVAALFSAADWILRTPVSHPGAEALRNALLENACPRIP